MKYVAGWDREATRRGRKVREALKQECICPNPTEGEYHLGNGSVHSWRCPIARHRARARIEQNEPPFVRRERWYYYLQGECLVPVEACSCSAYPDPECVVAVHARRARESPCRAPVGHHIARREAKARWRRLVAAWGSGESMQKANSPNGV